MHKPQACQACLRNPGNNYYWLTSQQGKVDHMPSSAHNVWPWGPIDGTCPRISPGTHMSSNPVTAPYFSNLNDFMTHERHITARAKPNVDLKLGCFLSPLLFYLDMTIDVRRLQPSNFMPVMKYPWSTASKLYVTDRKGAGMLQGSGDATRSGV